jgi:CheY-like chemotaxis protein
LLREVIQEMHDFGSGLQKPKLDDEVLSELRHAIVNPLTVLLGYCEVLASRKDLPDDVALLAHELLTRARECAGAVERLFFVLSGENEMAQPDSFGHEIGQEERHAKVLVVDDEVVIQGLIAKVLSKEYKVVNVSTGEEALKLLEKERFDCVILDMNLGGELSGRDLLERMQAKMPHLARRTLIIGGGSKELLSQVASEFSLGGYVQKPFRPDVLRQIVLTMLLAKQE